MDNFETKVKILINIVEEKNKMLETIYNITENQETLLKNQGATEDFKLFFTQMSEEKQKYIDKVIEGDRLFQKFFLELDKFFEEGAKQYKELILNLQEKIKIATELDIKIRAIEQKNKGFLEIRGKVNKPVPSDISKKHMIDKYKQNDKG